ncbi:hypothetical protein ACIQYL_20875 [Lysinibacillus xylanilyticus]|uniref:hypothetical protein n=1 Tax=Lysinibacillus xylanilyticus TaxID=582475 RepID=UPI0037F148C2
MEKTIKVPKKASLFSTLKLKAAVFVATLTFAFLSATVSASADESKALSNAGITKKALEGTGTETLFTNLNKVVYLVMAVGGIWAVIWIIIGGMLLSGSGSNAQKRTAGMGAIMVAAVGVYVIYKAYTIAGWALSIGG